MAAAEATGSGQHVLCSEKGISNHQPHDCLPNRLFMRRSKKTSKLRVTGLCAGNSPVTGEFPAQTASNAENVSIWWRHHAEMVHLVENRPFRSDLFIRMVTTVVADGLEMQVVRAGAAMVLAYTSYPNIFRCPYKNGWYNGMYIICVKSNSKCHFYVSIGSLTTYRKAHWVRVTMTAIFQTTFSNAFSQMKIYEIRLKFHWSLFLVVQLTIFQHWGR